MTTFTFEEALKSSLEYFEGDELAANVFVSKYALYNPKDGLYYESNPSDMHRRLAREFARNEAKYSNSLSEQEIYQYLANWEIVPQGSPMAGMGNPFQLVSLSNCYVIGSPQDAITSIFRKDQEEALIMRRRGGVGFDISNLRPKGAPTNNAARTTDGIATFMERYSDTCRTIAQGGRRGALLLSISVHHPEIRTFLTIKRNLKKVTGANISVRVTDEFMQAVENKTKVELRFPVDKGGKVYEEADATELWNMITESAHGYAEPGLLFWDTVLRNTPSDAYAEDGFRSVSTNPCQPAWATVLTPDGIRTIGDLEIGSTIWSGRKWTKVVNKWSNGIKPIYRFRTKAGDFVGTENHRIVSRGVKIEVSQAKSIDISTGPGCDVSEFDLQSVMDGLVLGDGSVHHASGSLVYLCIGSNDHDYFYDPVSSFIGQYRPGIHNHSHKIKTSLTTKEVPPTYLRKIPDRFRFSNTKTVRSFLRGLYSANGSVVSKRVTLKAASLDVIIQVQEMLSSLGIPSYYTTNKANFVDFKNGKYLCKQSYDLNITHGRLAFKELIGFVQKYKQDKLNAICAIEPSGKKKITFDIIEKIELGKEEVYDLTVDDPEHTYWTGGLLVSNCGEIILSGDESGADACRLLLVNTLKFVRDPFTKKATFDYDRFHKVCRIAQRLMDDIVDLEIECNDKILDKIKSDPEDEFTKSIEMKLWEGIKAKGLAGRRTGTGVTAIGDTLAALGISYGSEKGVDTVREIYKTLELACCTETIFMAEQRGAFPVFNLEKEKDHPFLKRIIGELPDDVQSKYRKFGRRNIALTTTAPAGSVSILTQTTSGIEPVFQLKYDRFKKVNPGDKDVKVDRVDTVGDSWQKFTVFHHGLKKWMDITGKTDPTESPYHGSTANEIDWVHRVHCQAAAQSYIEHSLSSTINLPRDVSLETVKKIYMEAWKSQLKGITVYRDGCRDGVLVTENTNSSRDIQYNSAPKRPFELTCEVHRANVKGDSWTIFIGLLNGKPYEIMGGLSKYIDIPKKIKSGVLRKNRRKSGNTYDFIANSGTDDELIVKDLAATFENPSYGSFSRTISLALRHGTPVQYVVEQLQKGDKDSDLFSFSKIMARVLKSKIVDGTKVSTTCKECGNNNIEYREGCATCMDCGYSKCG